MFEDDVDGKNVVQPLWMIDRCIPNYRANVTIIRNRTVTIRYQMRNKKPN